MMANRWRILGIGGGTAIVLCVTLGAAYGAGGVALGAALSYAGGVWVGNMFWF